MTQPTHMRSLPKQERGEKRMQLLLDAAEQAFAELGYKATTTNEIAARAHTSIGTLYRFFPNKEAIVHYLIECYMQELQTMREDILQPEMETMPLAAMIDRLVDPVVALKASHPGLVSLFIGPQAVMQASDDMPLFFDEGILYIEKLWRRRFPHVDEETCHLYAVVFFKIRQTFLSLAAISRDFSQERIIQEMKVNLFRYLEPIDSQRP